MSAKPAMTTAAGPEFVTSMADDQSRLLTHYLRFVVDGESGPLRERMQRGLVERALKTGNREHTMTIDTIKANIERSTSLPDYPRSLVIQTVNDLVARGYIEDAGPAKHGGRRRYKLSEVRFDVLEASLNTVEAQEVAFKSSVVEKIETASGRLSAKQRRQVEDAFHEFVGGVLGKLGEHCALNLVEKKQWDKASEYPHLQKDMERAVRTLPSEVQDAAREAFEQTLTNPTDAERDYLFSVGQVYYLAELLHLDPELQGLQRERFEETFLYLDTNLIIAALLKEDDFHRVVTSFIRLCRSLGLNLRFTPRTVDEFENLIDVADREYQKHPPFSHEMAAKLAGAVDSPFLQAYFASWPEEKFTWAQYRTRLMGWQSVMKKEGIELDPSCPSPSTSRQAHLKGRISAPRQTGNGTWRRRSATAPPSTTRTCSPRSRSSSSATLRRRTRSATGTGSSRLTAASRTARGRTRRSRSATSACSRRNGCSTSRRSSAPTSRGLTPRTSSRSSSAAGSSSPSGPASTSSSCRRSPCRMSRSSSKE
jgi:hypothetical protein